MAGRPEFWEPHEITAVPSEKLLYLTTVAISSTAPGGTENVQMTLPNVAGEKYFARLVGLYINAPAVPGAASGTHQVDVGIADRAKMYMWGQSAYNQPITFEAMEWVSATTGRGPSDGAAVATAAGAISMSQDQGLWFRYRNNTDVALTTGNRTYTIIYARKRVE